MDFQNKKERNVIEAIKNIKDVLPKKQKQLCNYILQNYKNIGILSVADLAKQAEVGTTTVMRLISTLHYTSYDDFKKDLFSVKVLEENSSYQYLKNEYSNRIMVKDEGKNLPQVGAELISLINNFLTPRNLEQYDRIIELLLKAKKINILGQRSSKAAASYFEYSLSPFLSDKTVNMSTETDFLYDKIMRIEPGEIMVLFSNWPCNHDTINAAHYCLKKKVPIVMITNSSANPIARFADYVIDTNSVGSCCLLSPTILIIEAIAFELSQCMAPKSTESLEELEKMLKDNSLLIW